MDLKLVLQNSYQKMMEQEQKLMIKLFLFNTMFLNQFKILKERTFQTLMNMVMDSGLDI